MSCGRFSWAIRRHPTPASWNWLSSRAPTTRRPRRGGPGTGFFLLSLQRDVDETLSALAALGFADGVRRITVPAPGGKTVPMAVITAPDGVLVELIGPAK